MRRDPSDRWERGERYDGRLNGKKHVGCLREGRRSEYPVHLAGRPAHAAAGRSDRPPTARRQAAAGPDARREGRAGPDAEDPGLAVAVAALSTSGGDRRRRADPAECIDGTRSPWRDTG